MEKKKQPNGTWGPAGGWTPGKPLTKRTGKRCDRRGQGAVGAPKRCTYSWAVEPWGEGKEPLVVREAGAFHFCSRDPRSGLVPLSITSLVPLHIARVHFQPEGPFIKLFSAQVLLSTSLRHYAPEMSKPLPFPFALIGQAASTEPWLSRGKMLIFN